MGNRPSVTPEFGERLIGTAGGLVSASFQALLMYPAAYLLERVLCRVPMDPERFRHLSLKILVVGLYALALVAILENNGYVSEEHAIAKGVQIATGLFTFSAAPLLLAWAIVALSLRRR